LALFKKMRVGFFLCAATAFAASPWDPKFAAMAKATLAKMTSDEKFTMVHGAGGGYVGNVPALTLSDGTVIPPINLEDGPQGVADGVSRVTAWPSALTCVSARAARPPARRGAASSHAPYPPITAGWCNPGTPWP
jgi:hypothetical protein